MSKDTAPETDSVVTHNYKHTQKKTKKKKARGGRVRTLETTKDMKNKSDNANKNNDIPKIHNYCVWGVKEGTLPATFSCGSDVPVPLLPPTSAPLNLSF